MSEEPRRYAEPAGAPDEEAPMTMDEIVDRAGRRITTALIVAGAMIGLGLYSQPAPPRYQMVASEGQILRIDTRKGTIIACEGERCATVLHHGQRLSSHLKADASPKPATALPASPAATPAPAPATAPAPPAAPTGR